MKHASNSEISTLWRSVRSPSKRQKTRKQHILAILSIQRGSSTKQFIQEKPKAKLDASNNSRAQDYRANRIDCESLMFKIPLFDWIDKSHANLVSLCTHAHTYTHTYAYTYTSTYTHTHTNNPNPNPITFVLPPSPFSPSINGRQQAKPLAGRAVHLSPKHDCPSSRQYQSTVGRERNGVYDARVLSKWFHWQDGRERVCFLQQGGMLRVSSGVIGGDGRG